MSAVVNLKASEIHTPHWARLGAADGQHQYILTGVIAPHLQGGGADWTARTLRATLPIGGLDGKKFTASSWAPSVSLAAINSEGATTNQGWAIDGFELVTPNAPNDHITLDVHTAVRDAACLLLRMTYQINLVGNLS